jgi:hypothetical protein
MQQQTPFPKKMLPLFFAFVLVNSIVLYYQKELEQQKVDALVVYAANGLLFILSVLSLAMHTRSIDKKNPNAAIRGVMAATLLKLLVLSIAALVYLFLAGNNRSLPAIFAGMILYVIYTFIEVRIASKPNQNNNAGK